WPLRATAASDRQMLADIAERLRDQLLSLRVEHASADGGDGTARFGLATPFQQRCAVASIDEVRARGQIYRAPKPAARDLHVDATLRRGRQELDFHLELTAHRPDADLHDRLEVCGVLDRDVDHFGKTVSNLLCIG